MGVMDNCRRMVAGNVAATHLVGAAYGQADFESIWMPNTFPLKRAYTSARRTIRHSSASCWVFPKVSRILIRWRLLSKKIRFIIQ
jgi:hypothetical protein